MTSSKPSSIKDIVITQAIAILAFVIVPIVLTLMAPLTNIEFRKSETGISATLVRYTLMFIPWRTEHLEQVTGIRADITKGKRYQGTTEERRKGQKGYQLATGQVAILHGGPKEAGLEAIVQADPDLANQIVKQFDDFKASESTGPLTFAVYASWSLSYILGGIATFFTALYILGAVLAIVTFPLKRMRVASQSKLT
ncbi:MAG: hypothetical protein SFV81_08090 [Pirellulaceae bacterium]|nr:hypothetical protein [Pirellulaceae bacterium]